MLLVPWNKWVISITDCIDNWFRLYLSGGVKTEDNNTTKIDVMLVGISQQMKQNCNVLSKIDNSLYKADV